MFWSYNLSHHHNLAHSSHAEPPEAAVGALERELVKVVGSGKGLNREQKKKLKESGCCERSSHLCIDIDGSVGACYLWLMATVHVGLWLVACV